MKYAGLIMKNQHGPDMPMVANLLKRLPLTVMRRVIGEPDGSTNAVEALNKKYPFPESYNWEWRLEEWVNATWGLYSLIDKSFLPIKCKPCDGDGLAVFRGKAVLCEECQGEGWHSPGGGDPIIRQMFVHFDGRVLEEHPSIVN